MPFRRFEEAMRFHRRAVRPFAIVAFCAAVAGAAFAQSLALPEPVGMEGDPAAATVLQGNAAFLHGDLRAAAGDYRKALRRKPDFAVATFNLGLVEEHQGRRDAGLRDMNRGISLAMQHGMGSRYVARLRALRDAFVSTPVAS